MHLAKQKNCPENFAIHKIDRNNQQINMSSSHSPLKILLIPASVEEVPDSISIANRLTGMEYAIVNLAERKYSSIRILEFSWNGTDIELWNMYGAPAYKDTLPSICFMDACGLIIVSTDPPVDFIQRNNCFFSSMDFPIFWAVRGKTTSSTSRKNTSHLESSLSALNVTKVSFSSPDEPILSSEFNHWIQRVKSYLAGNRNR